MRSTFVRYALTKSGHTASLSQTAWVLPNCKCFVVCLYCPWDRMSPVALWRLLGYKLLSLSRSSDRLHFSLFAWEVLKTRKRLLLEAVYIGEYYRLKFGVASLIIVSTLLFETVSATAELSSLIVVWDIFLVRNSAAQKLCSLTFLIIHSAKPARDRLLFGRRRGILVLPFFWAITARQATASF